MSKTDNANRFAAFKALHQGELLVVANAWDAGSARLIESLGAKAIATTSAGMAWSAGYGDGNKMPADVVVGIAANIARLIEVPLSIDIEGGYSSEPEEVAKLVLRLAEAGVTGINLEDGREPPELLARKIEALKSALKKAGLDVFVNARTDVYLAGLVDAAQRVEEVQQRAQRYQAAGADGLFVPAITALPEMRRVADATPLPLNVMAWEGLAPPEQLAAAGVRRLSAGAGISARVWSEAREQSRRFLADGRLGGSAMPFPELQKLFA